MAQQSLYRRYRPRRFEQIKGQDHVVRALQNAVANEAEGHAYLFSGPRGTGKTSTARILAKALNCTNLSGGEPCCECDSCLAIETGRSFDLFELDAASNNGVDAVRDLVERSAVGSPGRTKVYILDEVHMLTAAASNALLKTLEEPPDHVRFVLATTDPQKVLPTIRSRTQHFEFQLLAAAELEAHVRWVVADAGLDVDDEAVAHAVRQGRGSVRDTLSALDQVVAAGGVMVRSEPVEQLFAALAGHDSGSAIVAVSDALAQGHDPRVLGEAFLSAVRDAFLLSLGVDTPHLVDTDRAALGGWAEQIGTAGLTRAMERVGESLVDMRNAADPRVPLEVALVQLTATQGPVGAADGGDADRSTDLADLTARVARLEKQVASAAAEAAPLPSGSQVAQSAQAPAAPEVEQPREPEAPVDARSAPRASPPSESSTAGSRQRPSAPDRRTKRSAPPPPPPRRAGSGGPSAAVPERPQPAAAPVEAAAGTPADADPGKQEPTRPGSPTPSPAAADQQSDDAGPSTTGADDTSAQEPDRDALVMAFADVVVPQLKGVAKAIYSAGRFVAVLDGAAVFSLENAPTRERAEKYRAQVEQTLGEHFGSPVPLRLIVESESSAYADAGSGSSAPSTAQAPHPPSTPTDPTVQDPPAASPQEEEAELVAHVDELEDADVATSGVDKLTAAFPGAELIDTEEAKR